MAALLGTLLFLFALLAFYIVSDRNRRPVKRTASEVAAVLKSLLTGTVDSSEWDYFVCVQIEDERLEAIRSRCIALWIKGSPSLQPGAMSPAALSDLGRQQVQALLEECELLVREELVPSADAAN